jgi:hypothetical protein
LLSELGGEFEGGEFVLIKLRPRTSSRPSVLPLHRGDAVVFAVRERPVGGPLGFYRTEFRHGISEIRAGRRHGLIINLATQPDRVPSDGTQREPVDGDRSGPRSPRHVPCCK